MSTELITYSEIFSANAKIYYELAIESSNLQPDTKRVAKGMGAIVIDIAAFIAFSVEKDGKVDTRDAVTYAAAKFNAQFSMIPNESVQCMTSTVELALAAESAFDGYRKGAVLNLVPGVGNKAFILLMIYHAFAVAKAALSFKDNCFAAQGYDQLIYVRATGYMGRQNFA